MNLKSISAYGDGWRYCEKEKGMTMTTNPDASKDRIERAKKLIAQKLEIPNMKFGIQWYPRIDVLIQWLADFAAAENQLLSTRVEELEKENAKYREALEHYADERRWSAALLEPGKWTIAKVQLYGGDNGYDVARSALTEKHDTAAGEGE